MQVHKNHVKNHYTYTIYSLFKKHALKRSTSYHHNKRENVAYLITNIEHCY